ncbi:MAG: tRNA (adenosine(37)-N6)-threonylcarbamoyltransferase complex ATPase subunit type 1 TsaE [Bacteroidales bacterium]|jgi:tRNA threonylcarbamoyladenosine biosynthesis protein TsaE|nr:tRNA (adenosine(37)-N6)-threonylcarbamoyltransferase complex ATPase subunit type 1 TsaE [Bacteroidales bacterium]
MIYKIDDINKLKECAKELLSKYSDKRVFAFYGEMGAGKTTFISAICNFLGAKGDIASPTFTIINEYEDKKGEPIFHFDCYRLNGVEDAQKIGIEEYFYSGNYCFIEWPEIVESLLPDDHIAVKLCHDNQGNNNVRIIEF